MRADRYFRASIEFWDLLEDENRPFAPCGCHLLPRPRAGRTDRGMTNEEASQETKAYGLHGGIYITYFSMASRRIFAVFFHFYSHVMCLFSPLSLSLISMRSSSGQQSPATLHFTQHNKSIDPRRFATHTTCIWNTVT